MNKEKGIFKSRSTTFFVSSLFFPRPIRQDVYDLYSFLRVADDYVDQIPTDKDGFYRLRRMYMEAVEDPGLDTTKDENDSTDQRVIKNILRLRRKYNFEPVWIEDFLDVMQSDLTHKKYATLDDTLRYMHGSAEVVGLMMTRIMGLPEEAYEAARLQGRAMQYINFIRDIDEDNKLDRQYFPAEDLKRFNLSDLSRETAHARPDDFQDFVHFQIERYKMWQTEAEQGYKFIPKRLRIPLQAATGAYDWTASQIAKNPPIIFERKVKPSKFRALKNSINLTIFRA